MLLAVSIHVDVKDVFYVFNYFYKKRVFNVFVFFGSFLFSISDSFYPTEPAKILLNLLKLA